MRLLPHALLAGLLPACDAIHLPAITPGVTRAAEVRERLGEPGFIHQDPDGAVVWEYSRQPAGIHCYMIRFGPGDIVESVDQVLTQTRFALVQPGQTPEDIRRLYGQPASRQIFHNLGEEVWIWKVGGDLPMEEYRFLVHFDLASGRVRRASQRIEPRG